jgi:hypothetical protein
VNDKNLIRLGDEHGGVVIDSDRFVGASFEYRMNNSGGSLLQVVLSVGNGQSITLTVKGAGAQEAYNQLRAKGVDL